MALIVNGERVDDAVTEQEFGNIKSAVEAASGNSCCCDRDEEFRGYARENIVARVLLTQESRHAVAELSAAAVDAELERIKAEHGGAEQFYAAVGATPEQDDLIRRDVEANLRVEMLLERVCADEAETSDESLRQHYETHIDKFTTPEKVRASHILIYPPRAEDREERYKELRALRIQACDGADFAALAREHSDKAREAREAAATGEDTKGDDGIDLGWFQRGEIMDEFEIVAFSLRVGEVSPVFTTPYGMHIIKLTDREPATPKPFDEVRDAVSEQAREASRDEKIRVYVKTLEAKATIEQIDESAEETE